MIIAIFIFAVLAAVIGLHSSYKDLDIKNIIISAFGLGFYLAMLIIYIFLTLV